MNSILLAWLTLPMLCLMGGALVLFIARQFSMQIDELVKEVDRCLPQTQCAQCGYAGCLPYARAVVEGEAIDKCLPGGCEVVEQLSVLLDRSIESDGKVSSETLIGSTVASINETACIGCVRCIDVCPVDAIVGANGKMHTVVQSVCTGCELCIDECPVDCIKLV